MAGENEAVVGRCAEEGQHGPKWACQGGVTKVEREVTWEVQDEGDLEDQGLHEA